jgi:hypothetical protein
MSGFPRLTLSDLEQPSASVTKQAVTAARSLPRLTLNDVVPNKATKQEIPYPEGNDLEIPHPLGSVKLKLSGPEARFFTGAGKRLTEAGQRVRQLVGDKSVQPDIDASVERDRALMDTTAGQFGYMMPDIIAGLQPTNIPNTVRAAATQGLVSGALVPTTTEEQKGYAGVLNPVVQSLGAAAGQKVLGGVANAAGKLMNVAPTALANTVNSALRASGRGTRLPVPEVPPASPAIAAKQKLMQQQGVRTSIGDIDPKSGWRSFEDLIEPVLGERRGFMTQQQDDLKRMLANTQAAVDKPVRDQAGNVVPNTFVMAQGIKDAYTANKKAAKDMFDNVSTLASQPGVVPIKPNETLVSAQRLLAEKPEYFAEMQDNPMWRKLLGVKRDTDLQASVILQQNGKPFLKPQELDFNEVKSLRSALGSEYRDADKPSRKRAYAIMLEALDKDLDAWGQNTGNKALNAAYGDARSFYKQNVVPYTDPQVNPSKSPLFRNIAVKDKVDSETIPKGVFKEDRQQLAQDFMDLATPTGQQGAKNELIDEVISSGLNPNTETGLSTSIINHGAKYKAPGAAVFSPAEQQALEDSIGALKTTRRAASMPLSEPRTGVRIAPWAAGTALVGGATVPAFYGLNAMAGEDLSPTQRILMAFGALPLAGAIGAKGAAKYTQSGLGQMLHFASPQAQSQGLGALQTLMRSGGRGFGSGMARGLQTEGLRLPQIMSGREEEDLGEFNY